MPIYSAFRRLAGARVLRARRRSSHRPRLAAALLGAVLAAAFVPTAWAQTIQAQPAPQPAPQPQAPVKTFGNWSEFCTANPPPIASQPKPGQSEVCFIVQQVPDKTGQHTVLKMTVGFFGPERQPGAVVALPLGIPLANGLQLVIDGKPLTPVPFEVCDRQGCQTRVALNDEVIAAMKAGKEILAVMQSREGQKVHLPISLSGFTAGFNAIQ